MLYKGENMSKVKLRSEISDEYKWDLTSIYKTDEDFYKDLKEVSNKSKEITKFKDTFTNSGKDLYDILKFDEEIDKKINHLYMYAHLNKDSDTTNTKYREMYEKVENVMLDYEEKVSFFTPKLLKIDYSKIEKYYKEYALLKEYEFTLERIYRIKEHSLSETEERIMSKYSKIASFPEEVYSTFISSDITFDNIKDENGNEVELTDSNFSVYIRSKDRRVREEAFQTLYNGYKKYKNSISLMLSNDIAVSNVISSTRKYKSSMDAALFSDNVAPEVYKNLVDTVSDNLHILYKYLDVKKEVLGVDELHLYDVYASLTDTVNKHYTFDEAKEIVLETVKVFGEDYLNTIKKAFDEKWIDIYPNKGKVGGAYSSGSYTTNPYILLNFQGQQTDVSTLIHELGHSMHTYYSKENNPYQYSHYRIFVAEVASTVNELLLSYYLYDHASDDKEKLDILNKRMELFRTTIFRQTMFASFEKELYEKAQAGEVLTSDLICDTYYELNKKYFGKDVVVDNEIRYEWERVPHFYYNFYVYKYATGLSAACDIVTRIRNKEENATENYLKFLKTGGSMYPLDELKVAGVDLTKKSVIENAINMFDETIEEFKKVYKNTLK